MLVVPTIYLGQGVQEWTSKTCGKQSLKKMK